MEDGSALGKQQVVSALVSFGKVLWLLADVATLMVRLLYNTLVYDTSQGSDGVGEARS